MTEILINIKKMYCKSCEVLIEEALLDNLNVSKCDVSYITGVASITFDDTKINLTEIKSIIQSEGFEVLL